MSGCKLVAIGKLHPKKVPWCRVFLLLDLYLGNISESESDTGRNGRNAEPAMSQPTANTPVIPWKVDDKGIAELAKEKELLNSVAVFFTATVKHYRIDSSVAEEDEDIDQGAVIVANARLMQGLGRTRNRAMDTLLKHKKEEKGKAKSVVLSIVGSNILSDAAKDLALEVAMHDRFYEIEKKYAAALVTARQFKGSRTKPSMLQVRGTMPTTAMSQPSQETRDRACYAPRRL